MRRVLSFIDWRFVLSVAFLVLVGQLTFNAWAVTDANEQLRASQSVERADASRERAELLRRIDSLDRSSRANADSMTRLQAWLDSQGIDVPDSVLRPSVSRDSDDDSDDDDDSSQSSAEAGRQTVPKRSTSSQSSVSSSREDESKIRDTIKNDPKVEADQSSGDKIEQKSPEQSAVEAPSDTRDTTTGDTLTSVSE